MGVDGAHAALEGGVHQYTRPAGHPPLCEVLARRYSTHLGRTVDLMAEVAVTVGASQALYLTLQALIDPGDEKTMCVLLKKPAAVSKQTSTQGDPKTAAGVG